MNDHTASTELSATVTPHKGNEEVAQPLVSVIIPAYNCASTIRRTIGSIMDQSYQRFEITAIYDGGSKDDTLKILKSMETGLLVPVRIIVTPHMGRSAARNVGWKASRGDILFFADSDEIYKREYLALAVEKITSADVAGVTITGTSWTARRTLTGRFFVEIYSKLQEKKQQEGSANLDWAWVFRKEAVESVGGYDEQLEQAEDRDLFLRIKERGCNFALVFGEHWFHVRPTEFSAYLRKTWYGATRRIHFSLKHRKWKEIANSLLPGVGVMTIGLSFLTLPVIFYLLLAAAVGLVITMMITRYMQWSFVSERRLIPPFVLFSLLTRVITSFGYMYGLMGVALQRILRIGRKQG